MAQGVWISNFCQFTAVLRFWQIHIASTGKQCHTALGRIEELICGVVDLVVSGDQMTLDLGGHQGISSFCHMAEDVTQHKRSGRNQSLCKLFGWVA